MDVPPVRPPFVRFAMRSSTKVVTLNEYTEKLNAKLQEKIDSSKGYNEQLRSILAGDFTDIVEKRLEVVRRKCDSFLASLGKELKDKAVIVQKSEHAKWRQKLKDNEDLLKEIESMQRKPNMNVLWEASSIMQKAPSCQIDQLEALVVSDDDERHFDNIFASQCTSWSTMG